MDKAAYILANKIRTEYASDCGAEMRLTDAEKKKYQKIILENIESTGTYRGKKNVHGISRRIVAAACAAVLLLSAALFRENVYAAIEQISWGLGNALGISGDLADYKEMVNTSITDNGYIVTLQEAVATEEKIVVNYTIQREDGKPVEEIPSSDGILYINGKRCDGASGGGGFLDEAQTTVGIATAYHVFGADMSGRNVYQLKIRRLDMESGIKGKWDFQFTADGTDLIADTKRFPLRKEFEIEDGVAVTLDELALNELEQRISYHTTKDSDYIFQLMAEDSDGRQIQFDTQTYRGKEGIGVMVNSEILYDGRIEEGTDFVRMTLYAVKLPGESGGMNNDYIQVGEPFEVNLSGR